MGNEQKTDEPQQVTAIKIVDDRQVITVVEYTAMDERNCNKYGWQLDMKKVTGETRQW